MQFPKLTPLQSRSAVSLAASFILLIFYLTISSPHSAYAVETDSPAPKDYSRSYLPDLEARLDLTHQYAWHDDEVEQNYEPDFPGLDRGIIGRAPTESQNLENNTPGKRNIQAGGDPHYWVFQNESVWGPHAPVTSGLPSPLEGGMDWGISLIPNQQNEPGGPQVVYVSLSVCDQPSSNPSNSNGAPRQLELYISVSSTNQQPGPGKNDAGGAVDGGFGNWTFSATNAIYFGVHAPDGSNLNGNYSYELAVSIDAPYASYVDTTFLRFLDSDTNAALLESNVTANASTTLNTTTYQQWMNMTPPFSVFALNQNNPAVLGIHKSFCGLKNHAEIIGNPIDQQASSVDMSMTDRAGGNPKEQFYIRNLNGSSVYSAYPAIDGKSNQSGGSVVGGGGIVWAPTSFPTKLDRNCRVIFDLPFCSEVAYAVPSNPNRTYTDVATFYNDNASSLYHNFTKSLNLVPCDTTSSAQYSLARNCTDCDNAYKKWLCAVVVPRCADFSSPSNQTWLKPRNINRPFINGTETSNVTDPIFDDANKSISYLNSSRYPLIDTSMAPGPYKEILPCAEMCYELVRSCPASLQFGCPLSGRGLETSYGNPSLNPLTNVTCNYLGKPTSQNVGAVRHPDFLPLTIACATALLVGVYF